MKCSSIVMERAGARMRQEFEKFSKNKKKQCNQQVETYFEFFAFLHQILEEINFAFPTINYLKLKQNARKKLKDQFCLEYSFYMKGLHQLAAPNHQKITQNRHSFFLVCHIQCMNRRIRQMVHIKQNQMCLYSYNVSIFY